MNVLNIFYPQPEWYQARIGLLTSSKIHHAITPRQKNKAGESKPKNELPELAARANLKRQMIAEMLTGNTTEHFVSAAMDWGTATEPKARDEYEYRCGAGVDALGLVMHPTNPRAAATADGLVSPNGILEIKCPETYTHLEYLENSVIPAEYLDQIDWQMACCGPEIEWCDFVSFDPRIKAPELQMLVIRRERNVTRIAEMELAANVFLEELIHKFELMKRGVSSLEDKLRASIKQAKGKFPEDPMGITDDDFQYLCPQESRT